MIPIKLTLKNFMSYGAEPVTLAFEGLHVACLSGDNGNGKSALLDAMTWALWDKTRAPSKDDVIRVGADEVEVRFEFELSGQFYRVTKKRRRGKATGSEWTLAQRDSRGDYTSIGGNSQKDVGKQIVTLLSMEYETFLNSAYLQQGHADEFTRQSPDKRKQILGEILGLERYARLEEKARERMKERKEAVEELEMQIRLLDSEIANLPSYEEQLEQTRLRLGEVSSLVEKQEAVTTTLRERKAHLDALAGQMEQARGVVLRIQEDIKLREAERCNQLAQLERLQKTIAQKEAIAGDYAQLQNASRRRDLLEPEIEAFNKANTELRTVIGVIDGMEKELRGEIRLFENKAQTAEDRVRERAKLEAQAQTLRDGLADSKSLEAELTAALALQEETQQAFADLSARNKELAVAITEQDEVLEMLAGPRASCPVCESDLSGQKRESVLARQQAKKAQMQQEQKQVKQEGGAKKQALTVVQEQVAALTKQRDEQTARANRLRDLTARLEGFAQAQTELETARKNLNALQTRLDKNDFAAPQRIQRQRLERELERLKLARQEYEVVRQQIARLEHSHKRYQELEHAESALPQSMQEIARLEQVLVGKNKERQEAETRRNGLQEQLGQYEEVKRQSAVAEADFARLQQELNGLKVAEGSFVKFIANCAGAAAQKKERDKERLKADDEKRLYTALANAFGRKGVQALIIENAIPELQEETNTLLARITDNAMQVMFHTTKILKSSKEEAETLDIEVMDDLGSRPYEMFSGGEAFRVNFAIRIALSRLLARRSGAKLQTLILDEGFGSQDGKGREKLIEAIEGIKEDFEKILVITHVDEMKDAFTHRIEVTKDANGSHVHVL